jgi:hypothetical protein
MNAAHAAGLGRPDPKLCRRHADWSPDVPLSAPRLARAGGISSGFLSRAGRAFELLQSATRDGGVHLVGTIVRRPPSCLRRGVAPPVQGLVISVRTIPAPQRASSARRSRANWSCRKDTGVLSRVSFRDTSVLSSLAPTWKSLTGKHLRATSCLACPVLSIGPNNK